VTAACHNYVFYEKALFTPLTDYVIKRIGKFKKEIEMINGEIALTTVRKIPKLLSLIEERTDEKQ